MQKRRARSARPSFERMALKRLFNKCLLRPGDFKSSQDDLEVIGAFNPGAIATKDGVVILVRIAEQAKEKRPGQTASPRWDSNSKRIVLDWENNAAPESNWSRSN